MCATSSECRAAPQRGFSMVELITVMLLVGVLAVVVMPRLNSAEGLRGTAWRDQLGAAALQARSTATGHRRLVCMAVASGEVRLRLASVNPATSCDTAIPGPDGDVRWAVDAQNLALSASPAATLYFQPDGRISQDGAGNSVASFTIGIAGETNLTLNGVTGHVQ